MQHTDTLKEDLVGLKAKLELVESNLQDQMKELKNREERWKLMDEKIRNFVLNENEIIRLNVGGDSFATKLGTLVSVKDTLFYKIVIYEKFDMKKEIFFDRFSNYFSYILDYLRYKRLNYNRFKRLELEELLIEADYYEVSDISDKITNMLKEIRFLNFEINAPFISSGTTAGSQNVEHINDHEDRTLMNGIVACTPGWIIFQLNETWEFNSIEVAGWNGNTGIFSPTNGAGATILTSIDKKTWTNVGSLPTNFGANISTVSLLNSSANYIKFQGTGYIGIGYLKINKK